jgi:hypothetical protein
MQSSSIILALAALPVCAAAQAVPTRALTTPDAEWSEPFSQISGIRELRNGKVIVADNRDKTIQLIDFKGEAKPIGREGAGPGEYGLPQSVYAAPGDSTWVFDVLNSRYLVIDPAGKPAATFTLADANAPATLPAPAGGGRAAGGRGALGARLGGIGLGFAQGIDAMGRLYFRAPTIRFGNDNSAAPDTTPIVRWDRRTKSTDTVGLLINPPSPAPVAVPSGGGGGGNVRFSVRIGSSTPFGASDPYVVTPNGDVAVVRARDYHVDWIVNGKTVSGAPIPYEKVKVTTDDKTAWMESRRNATATMVVNDGSGRKVQNMPMSALEGGDAPAFPEFKGPFSNAVAGPNGQVWVQRQMPVGSPPSYDVIDQSGRVVSRVVLPKSTRLLGFGAGTVYLARSDEDDLQYVQRYRW